MEMSKDAIWVIALAGSAIGILGGVLGTWATIHGAKGPMERRLAYKFAAFGLVYMIGLVVWFLTAPAPYNMVFHLLNFGLLMQIPRANRWFQKARDADENEAFTTP